MCSPVRDDIYVVNVPGTPTVSDIEPTVFVQFQTERRVERLAGVINVNARNVDSHFPYITHVNIHRVSCIVEPHIFGYGAFAHILLNIGRYNVCGGSGNSHGRNGYDGKQETAENWRNSPLITHESSDHGFHFFLASQKEFQS
jgi:hypothetical protein